MDIPWNVPLYHGTVGWDGQFLDTYGKVWFINHNYVCTKTSILITSKQHSARKFSNKLFHNKTKQFA